MTKMKCSFIKASDFNSLRCPSKISKKFKNHQRKDFNNIKKNGCPENTQKSTLMWAKEYINDVQPDSTLTLLKIK